MNQSYNQENTQEELLQRRNGSSLNQTADFKTLQENQQQSHDPNIEPDLQSQASHDLNYDNFVKKREQKAQGHSKSQAYSDSKSMRNPATTKSTNQILPFKEREGYTGIHEEESEVQIPNQEDDGLTASPSEPTGQGKKMGKFKATAKSIAALSGKSGKTQKSTAPEVMKASGVEVSEVKDEDLLPPRDEYPFISRNTVKFNDERSFASETESEEGDAVNKSSAAYLEKVRLKLEKEMLRTNLMIEAEQQKKALGAKSDQDVKPNKRFKNFNDVFAGLTRSKQVATQDPMISCIISLDSMVAIAITKKSDRMHYVHQFLLETSEMTFMEEVGGRLNDNEENISYIKCNEVEQNDHGDQFAMCYLDDGYFYCRMIPAYHKASKPKRTREEIVESELDVNKALGLDNHTMPIDNFPDPFIDCTFVSDDILFINLFHNKKIEHHHFFYHWKEKRIEAHKMLKIDSSPKNFPTKCFYNQEYNEVYTFYRQGQSYRVPVLITENDANYENEKLKKDHYYQKIFDKDLGQMFLVNETALVTRSSKQILFFRLMLDEFTGQKYWDNYYTLEEGGNIFFIKGNKRIQVVTDTKIFFYLIDFDTYEVTLENLMSNFMNCSIMMFGPKVKYGVTYKTNEQSFDIYRRKFVHDFKVNVVNTEEDEDGQQIKFDLDGSRGLPVESMDAFLVSKIDEVRFFDIHNFKEIKDCRLELPLFESDTREPNQIISMQISKCENYLACMTGKQLIMAENKTNQIFVFKRVKNLNVDAGIADKFELLTRTVVKDIPEFEKISMQFLFKNTKYGRDPDTLIFVRKEKIFQLNFMTEQVYDLALFDVPLLSQPEFFLMTEDQDIAIIATPQDGIYFNMSTGMWVDLDEHFDIGSIKEIIHEPDTRQIYFLANRYQGKTGVFLIKFHEQNPKVFDFFLKYKTNLDIADADIAVMKNQKSGFKELIISFKTVIENTYNVYIVDISGEKPWPLFRHESFQLWETQITAFFINKTNDYITINQDGISLISLDSFDKRYVKSADGQEKQIHAIESVNYLKVDANNFIYFDFSGHTKRLRIIQQFKKMGKNGEESAFEDIYSLKVHDITLRELLLFQSLYVSPTQTDILNLVKAQDNPRIFYKTFLELDGTNMTSILSFDSRCINDLLGDENTDWFSPEYPLFYKNKIQKTNNKEKFFYRSAIDMALEANQLTAAHAIIKYIYQHQDNYVSSFLFTNNIIKLMQKGVQLQHLFDSKVFNYTFDYDEWPSTHAIRETYSRPYNGNLFEIRSQYREIFPEEKFAVPDENKAEASSTKIFKISYKMNILIQSGEYCEWGNEQDPTKDKTFVNKKVSFMDECFKSKELDLFISEAIVDILNFKWKAFATNFHMVGCVMHFAYMFLLFNYINQIYINYNMENKNIMNVVLCAGLLYPCIYELYQLKREKWGYFNDINNINDQLYVWCGLANLISVQATDPQAFQNKMILTVILFQQILKTFFYLRIFATLSYIVTMIFQVVKDLRAFLIFFFILVVLFGLIFAVMGAGNQNQPGEFKTFYDEAMEEGDDFDGDIPNEEYASVGLFFGNMFYTLRTGIGDFDFGAAYFLKKNENWTFFILWFMVVVILCIIFLNFIIAEASASYADVMDNLDALKNKEKASLISEAETMIPDKFKSPIILPKFIVIRQEDS